MITRHSHRIIALCSLAIFVAFMGVISLMAGNRFAVIPQVFSFLLMLVFIGNMFQIKDHSMMIFLRILGNNNVNKQDAYRAALMFDAMDGAYCAYGTSRPAQERNGHIEAPYIIFKKRGRTYDIRVRDSNEPFSTFIRIGDKVFDLEKKREAKKAMKLLIKNELKKGK